MTETLSDKLREAAEYFPSSELEVACRRAADIIDELPTTADGVLVVLRQKIYHPEIGPFTVVQLIFRDDVFYAMRMLDESIYDVSECYSTREAALAAAGKGEK